MYICVHTTAAARRDFPCGLPHFKTAALIIVCVYVYVRMCIDLWQLVYKLYMRLHDALSIR